LTSGDAADLTVFASDVGERYGAPGRTRRACALLLGGLAAALCLTAAGGWAHAQGKGSGKPQPVVVAVARTVDLVDRVEALGTTRANETVQITSTVTEKVVSINFDDGESVKAGDILVTLSTAEEEADLKAAQAVLAERRLAFNRASKLESQKFTSTAQLEERRANLRQAEADIEVIKARIADRIIRAPFDGVLGLRNISPGMLVEPGKVITTLDDLRVIKVDFAVPSTYLSALHVGLPITAKTAAFGQRTFEGQVSGLASQVDPVTRSIVARAILPNPDGVLKPGLLVTIELLKNPRRAIMIPEDALIPLGARNHVFVVGAGDDTKAVRRDVEIGARRPGEVEIVSGLKEGERVITRGTLQVRAGQRVHVLSVMDGGQADQGSAPTKTGS
jgi:membrane fusion protein (multidrug efflux system)